MDKQSKVSDTPSGTIWSVQTAMPRPAEHNMERRHVNAITAASQVDIGNVIDPKVFYQLAETDTRNGMAGETSRRHTLSKKHRMSLLITSHMHNCGHPGVATTTAKSRRKYWVLKANKRSKAVKFKCVTCRGMANETKT